MKVCIYGAGAIGGHIGGHLVRGGADVSVIARGPHLEAMQKNGLRVYGDRPRLFRASERHREPCGSGPAGLRLHHAEKSHQVDGVLEKMQPLLGPETAVIPHRPPAFPGGTSMAWKGRTRTGASERLDPGGRQWDLIGPERALGCALSGRRRK